MDVDADSAKVRFPPPFIYLGFLLIGLAADTLLHLALPLAPLTRGALALPLVFGGAFLLLAASGRFRAARTNVRPWKASTAIVDRGVYAVTRNPMYLGMALVYTGIAIACGSIFALILLPELIAVIQTQVIAREERYLEGKFGDAYRAYKARVRRWV